jgi:phage terminase large subunit-like protein
MSKKHQFDYNRVEQLAASGLPFEEMAAVPAASHDPVLRRRKDDPLFNQAVTKGKPLIKAEVSNLLIEQARKRSTHAGFFAAPEDQLCMGPGRRNTADPVGALVWALTDLALEKRTAFHIF